MKVEFLTDNAGTVTGIVNNEGDVLPPDDFSPDEIDSKYRIEAGMTDAARELLRIEWQSRPKRRRSSARSEPLSGRDAQLAIVNEPDKSACQIESELRIRHR
ncbi:MAG: hypothetical protein ABI397_00080 [Candidatus Saccharimonas sp.]